MGSWLSWLHDVLKQRLLFIGSCFILIASPAGFVVRIVDNSAVVVSDVKGVVGIPCARACISSS